MGQNFLSAVPAARPLRAANRLIAVREANLVVRGFRRADFHGIPADSAVKEDNILHPVRIPGIFPAAVSAPDMDKFFLRIIKCKNAVAEEDAACDRSFPGRFNVEPHPRYMQPAVRNINWCAKAKRSLKIAVSNDRAGRRQRINNRLTGFPRFNSRQRLF